MASLLSRCLMLSPWWGRGCTQTSPLPWRPAPSCLFLNAVGLILFWERHKHFACPEPWGSLGLSWCTKVSFGCKQKMPQSYTFSSVPGIVQHLLEGTRAPEVSPSPHALVGTSCIPSVVAPPAQHHAAQHWQKQDTGTDLQLKYFRRARPISCAQDCLYLGLGEKDNTQDPQKSQARSLLWVSGQASVHAFLPWGADGLGLLLSLLETHHPFHISHIKGNFFPGTAPHGAPSAPHSFLSSLQCMSHSRSH